MIKSHRLKSAVQNFACVRWQIPIRPLTQPLFWGVGRLAFWAVVTTHPQSEQKALTHLLWQGFECYAPRERTVKISHGRKVFVERYLFPRYLFVWIQQQWHVLLSTFGISRVLMNGEVPAQLPSTWVTEMKSKEHNGFVVLPRERYKIGEPVRINAGLFQGQIGLYQGMTSRQREVVMLSNLGRVELASGDLT